MTEPKHVCGGTWKPLPGQFARYRCDVCGVIGLKERLVTDGLRGVGIRPYRCERRIRNAEGKSAMCGAPMVGNDERGRHACREHRGTQ